MKHENVDLSMNNALELAEGLQNSNEPSVVQVSRALLALKVSYDELQHRYVMLTSELVMNKYGKLFKHLAESGD